MHPQCTKGNFQFYQNCKSPGLLWGKCQPVSWVFLGSPCCTPPCSLLSVHHVDSSTGRVRGSKNLAGGQSSRNRCRCCYLHHFHVRKNKEQEAANKSQEPSSCPAQQLSQSQDWSRQGTTLQTWASLFWWSALAKPLQSRLRRRDIRIPTCHCCGSSLGDSCWKPISYSVLARQQGQIDDWSPPHSRIWIVDALRWEGSPHGHAQTTLVIWTAYCFQWDPRHGEKTTVIYLGTILPQINSWAKSPKSLCEKLVGGTTEITITHNQRHYFKDTCYI